MMRSSIGHPIIGANTLEGEHVPISGDGSLLLIAEKLRGELFPVALREFCT